MVAKEIIITEGGCIVVNVIYHKSQLLDLLEPIAHLNRCGKVWVLCVNNCFCAAILHKVKTDDKAINWQWANQ